MSAISIAGDTSGSITLQAPAVAGTTTLTLPATTGNLATEGVGQGQTWTDVKASRALGTTYTNTTGRPIFVSVNCALSTSTVVLRIDGVDRMFNFATSATVGVCGIVPNGSTYSVLNGTLNSWMELR